MISMLLNILRREVSALSGSCFNSVGEMLSSPGAIDFREKIANFNSEIVKLLVRT